MCSPSVWLTTQLIHGGGVRAGQNTWTNRGWVTGLCLPATIWLTAPQQTLQHRAPSSTCIPYANDLEYIKTSHRWHRLSRQSCCSSSHCAGKFTQFLKFSPVRSRSTLMKWIQRRGWKAVNNICIDLKNVSLNAYVWHLKVRTPLTICNLWSEKVQQEIDSYCHGSDYMYNSFHNFFSHNVLSRQWTCCYALKVVRFQPVLLQKTIK